MARWLRFAVPRALDRSDALALHEELRRTPRADTTLSHYTMLDGNCTTLALIGFWRSPQQMQQEPDSIGAVERVLHALTGEKSAVDTAVMRVLGRPEDVADPWITTNSQRAVVTDMGFVEPLQGSELTDLLDSSRDALQGQPGFHSCCVLADSERPRLIHLSLWDRPASIDVTGVERLIEGSRRERAAPVALTSSAREFDIVGAHVHPETS